MSPEWETLPLLPLRCILDHLSLEDATAAMSVCRHWRSAALLYEGHKETLTLRAKHLDQCLYLTRLFRKYTNKLHIYLDCNQEEMDKFMSYVLPQFFDTVKLYEILFIGPSYSEQNPLLPVVKLKRVITETLIYKHSHSLRKLAMLGCEMGIVKNENDRFIHKNVEYYSRALSFPEGGAADAILSRANTSLMEFSTLQHLVVDYEQINTDALETLSQLAAFSRLTMNVNYNSQIEYSPIDWDRLDACYTNALDVSVNFIEVPMDKMDEVIYIVLREGMLLTSLKVLYCKTLYQPVLEHIVRHYKETLRELVWADGPEDVAVNRFVHPDEDASQFGLCNVNPFILLCWQCSQLRRLVIHGYWVWQYDVLGFVRLCSSLGDVEVPALYRRQSRFRSSDRAVRVLATDQPQAADDQFVEEMNEYTEFQWEPTLWSKLHPGLQARASPHQRSAYLLQEALQPLGVT